MGDMDMKYLVNGIEMTRKELENNVLEVVLDLGKEKSPLMAYRECYTVEHNVNRHACKIARDLGWDVEAVR